MRFLLLVTFYFSAVCASFAQQAVITGDVLLCPNSNGTAMVQGIVPYDSYQWQKKEYGQTTFTNVAGATSSTFTYDSYNYSLSYIRCQVSQGGATFFSNELLIDSLVFLPPFFSTDTQGDVEFDPNTGNYVICPGGTITNIIMNAGNVQWFKDNVAIPGANTASYTITVPGTYYAATAPAECPASSSNSLPIVVVYGPQCAPQDVTPVIAGDTMLCPNAEGMAGTVTNMAYDTYQWQVKFYGETAFADVPGATAASFTYGQVEYSVSEIRLKVTLGGETYYSNVLFIDGYAFSGITVGHQYDPEVVGIGPDGAFLICPGDIITNTVNQPYTTNVKWYKNGELIAGATSATYVITEPGEYYVSGSPAVCPDFSLTALPFTVTLDPECTAGINNPDTAAFALYPNPAGTTLNLSLSANSTLSNYTIIDVTGKTLMSGTLSGTAPAINIEALATGSYIIKATGPNVQATKMFLKQ